LSRPGLRGQGKSRWFAKISHRPCAGRGWGAAAAWRKGDALTLNLLPQLPEAQAGVMVVEAQADPALPVGYVQPAEPE